MRRTRRFGLPTSLLAIVGGLVCYAAPAAAQQALAGRVVDAAGAPVPDLDVLLHRVTSEGGAVAGHATTGSDGSFRIEPAGDGDGIYFAAVRYEGELHIGPMIRPPFDAEPDYVVRLGDPVEASPGPAASTTGTARPLAQEDSGLGPLLVIGALGGATAAAVVLLARRPSARRRTLIRLAREEERAMAGRASGGGPAA